MNTQSRDGTGSTSSATGKSGEIFGGLASMLVALPSAIAFGLIVYAPLGGDAVAIGALAGIIGAITLGIVAPIFGGAPGIITAPCAPAAAVMGALAISLVAVGPAELDPELIPLLLVLAGMISGILQFFYGILGGGSIIKFIPYPVVAGYLSGVGIIIFTSQLPKFLGMPKGSGFFEALGEPALWQNPAIVVGAVAILAMVYAGRITKLVPAPIIALGCGVAVYFGLSLAYPGLLSLDGNPYVIGAISSGDGPGFFEAAVTRWSAAGQLDLHALGLILVPALTLSVLLSIDTLKTGVILDALTRRSHNSNREIVGQGLGNIAAALTGGMPGAGTMGPTLVNVTSGGRTRLSGILNGAFALTAFLLIGDLVAWIPVAALAGILMVVGVRMIDREMFHLLLQKSTLLDFMVIFLVVVTAVAADLMSAAGVGVGFAILLFLREQIRSSVVRRTLFGNETFSKKRRLPDAMAILERDGKQTVVIELQGPLFFGTADQLLSEIRPLIAGCKYIILHMKRVSSLDFTAAHRLEQVEVQLADQEGQLILADLPRSMSSGMSFQDYLSQVGLLGGGGIRLFDELDSALAWAEDRTIQAADIAVPSAEELLDLSQVHILTGLSPDDITMLRPCVTERSFKSGEKIFSRGNEEDELFLIRRGTVKIMLPLKDDRHHHIVTFGRGDFFGDMSFLDNAPRSADAVVEDDCDLYVISRADFNLKVDETHQITEKFFTGLCTTMADRLRQANLEIRALQES